MRLKSTLLLIFIFCFSEAFSQKSIGYYHDLDGLPVYDHLDPFEYTPKKALHITHHPQIYELGTVYYADGNIQEGSIRFENKKIWFKKEGEEKREKLKPEEVIGFTIGVDSFFVAKNFNVEQQLTSTARQSPQFMQYLTSFDGKVFAKHYNFSSGLAQAYAAASPLIVTYQVKDAEENYWTSFPKKSASFQEIALKYFGHIDYLKRKIEDKSLKSDDTFTLIKSAEFYFKYQEGASIYFDQYWNETTEELSFYQAKIRSLKQDSIWTIDYEKEGKPIYRARFYSLFPFKREGEFEKIGPRGFPTEVSLYEKNSLKRKTINGSNGEVMSQFSVVHDENDRNDPYEVTYEVIGNETTENLIKSGKWTHKINTSQGAVIQEHDNDRLLNAYRIIDGEKIHQALDPNYDYHLKKLQKSLNVHFYDMELPKAVEANAQGKYFLSIALSEKGRVVSYELHNSIHPEVDSAVKEWGKRSLLIGEENGLKLRKYKINNKPVAVEFLVPIQFNTKKMYRQSTQYYYDWGLHNMMQQQIMMQQQMNLTPPPAPRF